MPNNYSWKAQPIFISSTFTDMMAERDVLRDFVFPRTGRKTAGKTCASGTY